MQDRERKWGNVESADGFFSAPVFKARCADGTKCAGFSVN